MTVTIGGGTTEKVGANVRLVETICDCISIVARVVTCWRASGASITVCETRLRDNVCSCGMKKDVCNSGYRYTPKIS